MIDKDVIIISILLSILCNWYFKPTQEVINCNENYLCTVEQVRFGNYKKTKTFQLSPYSIIIFNKKDLITKHTNYVYYVDFIDKEQYKPFIYYAYDYENAMFMDDDEKRFKSYLINPKKENFILYSKAGKGLLHSFIPSVIIFIIIILIIAIKNNSNIKF